jgi:hypothetical protein
MQFKYISVQFTCSLQDVGLQVLTALLMKSMTDWDLTLCSSERVQCFTGTYQLHLQGGLCPFWVPTLLVFLGCFGNKLLLRPLYSLLLPHPPPDIHIVAYLLKARTVEPEKQPWNMFVGNGHKTANRMMSVARQQILNKQEQMTTARERLSKHVPAATDMHVTDEWCFLRGPCWDVISKGQD